MLTKQLSSLCLPLGRVLLWVCPLDRWEPQGLGCCSSSIHQVLQLRVQPQCRVAFRPSSSSDGRSCVSFTSNHKKSVGGRQVCLSSAMCYGDLGKHWPISDDAAQASQIGQDVNEEASMFEDLENSRSQPQIPAKSQQVTGFHRMPQDVQLSICNMMQVC